MKSQKKMSKTKRAVFLDRDGVINEMVYNADFGTVDSPLRPREFKLKKNVTKTIKEFKKRNFLVVVVSNQPAVAKGKMSLSLLKKITKKMKMDLEKKGAELDKIYYCLHHPDPLRVKNKKYLKDCNCRKPKPGLLLKASKDLSINLPQSYMIGDGLTDIEAGRKAGCNTIFLGKLKPYWEDKMKTKPDFIAKNHQEVIKIIKRS